MARGKSSSNNLPPRLSELAMDAGSQDLRQRFAATQASMKASREKLGPFIQKRNWAHKRAQEISQPAKAQDLTASMEAYQQRTLDSMGRHQTQPHIVQENSFSIKNIFSRDPVKAEVARDIFFGD